MATLVQLILTLVLGCGGCGRLFRMEWTLQCYDQFPQED
jgi:hypothetical protein